MPFSWSSTFLCWTSAWLNNIVICRDEFYCLPCLWIAQPTITCVCQNWQLFTKKGFCFRFFSILFFVLSPSPPIPIYCVSIRRLELMIHAISFFIHYDRQTGRRRRPCRPRALTLYLLFFNLHGEITEKNPSGRWTRPWNKRRHQEEDRETTPACLPTATPAWADACYRARNAAGKKVQTSSYCRVNYLGYLMTHKWHTSDWGRWANKNVGSSTSLGFVGLIPTLAIHAPAVCQRRCSNFLPWTHFIDNTDDGCLYLRPIPLYEDNNVPQWASFTDAGKQHSTHWMINNALHTPL